MHQNCWVHLRRELLMVILPSEMLKEIGNIPEEQFDQAIEEAFKDNARFLKLWKVQETVNQLFRIQNIKNSSAELLWQRRSLADMIDLIVTKSLLSAKAANGSSAVTIQLPRSVFITRTPEKS